MASADFSPRLSPSPFQAQGEISPGKNTLLHRTTAGFTPLCLGHKSFAASCPLALLGSACYPVLVHRLTVYAPRFLPTVGRPSAVALHFVRCGQLTGGLAPPGVRPCRAHKKNGPWRGPLGVFGVWEGFETTMSVTPYTLSRRAPSTARTPHRTCWRLGTAQKAAHFSESTPPTQAIPHCLNRRMAQSTSGALLRQGLMSNPPRRRKCARTLNDSGRQRALTSTKMRSTHCS